MMVRVSKKALSIIIAAGVIVLVGVIILAERLGWDLKRTSAGSCVVLEEQYCGQGHLIDFGEGMFVFGFNLPEGATIFAPFEGVFRDYGTAVMFDKEQKVAGMEQPEVSVPQAPRISFSIVGDFELPDDKTEIKTEAAKPIAKIRKIAEEGSYNLFINFGKYNEEIRYFTPDKEILGRYFKQIQ